MISRGNHCNGLFSGIADATRKTRTEKGLRQKDKIVFLFDDVDKMIEAPSPVYGETNVTLRYHYIDLLWRPIGIMVRFVLVDHPARGRCISDGN